MTPKRKKWPIIVGILVAIIALLLVGFLLMMPKVQAIQAIDLQALADGTYTGACENGLVAASVSVDIADHQIQAIDLLSHRYGMGQPAEAVVSEILAAQSLDVDTVSGATFSSNAIIKAVANALSPQREQP